MTSSASRLSLALLLAAAPAAALPSPGRLELPALSLEDALRAGDEGFSDVLPMPVGFGETAYREYADAAERLEAAGADFPGIFRRACAEARRRGGGAGEAKVMLAGLVTWLGDRAAPRGVGLQGRLDWAFHFVYGAWLESISSGLGERAGLEKEARDARTPGNAYDLDDLAATLLGARWATRETARLGEWGSGARRLESLPRFPFGKLAPGRLASEAQLRAVRDFAAAALP